MNEVLKGYNGNFCFVYLDDVIIYSNTLDEHLVHIEKILQIFKDANLTINLEKSEFCKREVTFLGHIVGKDGISRDP